MKKSITFLICMVCTLAYTHATVKADFRSAEATQTYYSNGFDGQEEFDQWEWTRTAPGNYSWYLATAGYIRVGGKAVDDYHNYNPASTHSLAINYGKNYVQDEIGLSPEIEILDGSTLGFWVCPGVFKVGSYDISANYDYTICLQDALTGDTTLVLRGSEFSDSDPNYAYYHWHHITYDLAKFTGKTVRIRIHYYGKGGDSMLLDDFEVIQQGSEEAQTVINQGEQVHFVNYSTGDNLTYEWHFPGGEPEMSTAQHPVVTYLDEGTYDVTLIVTNGTNTDAITRYNYVSVEVASPVANVKTTQNVYHRVGGGISVPNNTWVTFHDNSSNYPTAWDWTFNGSNQPQSYDQSATVYYPNAGYFNYSLTASNKAGADTYTSASRAVKVGGAANYVWNLNDEDAANPQIIKLNSNQGYFGGSNTRRMWRWAECFERPASPATISKIGVLFLETTTFKPDTTIAVSINLVGDDGFPGEMIAYASKKLSACKVGSQTNPTESDLTEFTLNKTVSVDEPFFVVIAGIPNYEMNHEGKINQVIIGGSHIGDPAKGDRNTTYMYLDSLVRVGDMLYFINKFHWEENSSAQPVSLALCPYLKMQNVASPPVSAIEHVGADLPAPEANITQSYFDLQGRSLGTKPQQGICIQRMPDGTYRKILTQ